MRKEIKEKIIKVIDAIVDQENATLDDGDIISIDKESLRKSGLTNNEINNILKSFLDKGFLEFGSMKDYYNFMIEDDEYSVIDKNGAPMSQSKKHELIYQNFVIVIPNFEKLNYYKNKLIELKIDNHLIRKDDDGYFYYKNQLIEMDGQNVYYKILDILYTFSDKTGFMSYEQIDNKLVKMTGEEKEDQELGRKRIKNAISETQGLFRYAKIDNKPLENKSIAGKKLIEIIKGKGLKLNNPEF